jgi:hypothetical protein
MNKRKTKSQLSLMCTGDAQENEKFSKAALNTAASKESSTRNNSIQF